MDCGGIYHHSLMDFDHVRGKKLTAVSNMKNPSHSPVKILAEIAKCELLCVICHRVRTWNRIHPEEQITHCQVAQ